MLRYFSEKYVTETRFVTENKKSNRPEKAKKYKKWWSRAFSSFSSAPVFRFHWPTKISENQRGEATTQERNKKKSTVFVQGNQPRKRKHRTNRMKKERNHQSNRAATRGPTSDKKTTEVDPRIQEAGNSAVHLVCDSKKFTARKATRYEKILGRK